MTPVFWRPRISSSLLSPAVLPQSHGARNTSRLYPDPAHPQATEVLLYAFLCFLGIMVTIKIFCFLISQMIFGSEWSSFHPEHTESQLAFPITCSTFTSTMNLTLENTVFFVLRMLLKKNKKSSSEPKIISHFNLIPYILPPTCELFQTPF